MQHIYKTAIALGISLAGILFAASSVQADGVTPTATVTPTTTPVQETRVECTTGAYGQQTCKTVVVEKTGPKKHEVVNSGLEENIVFALVIGFALSAAGYQFSKVRA